MSQNGKGQRMTQAARTQGQRIVTLEAKQLLNKALTASDDGQGLCSWDEGSCAQSDAVLLMERHQWCALYDQIIACLQQEGPLGFDNLPEDLLTKWIVHVDFGTYLGTLRKSRSNGAAKTRYRSAAQRLVEQGFSMLDADGRTWHYTIFDKSANMARHSTISFIADLGYHPATGRPLRIVDELNERLCLHIDFQKLAQGGTDVSWSKYFAYRGLYMSTCNSVDIGPVLDERTVLVLEPDSIPLDILARYAEDPGTHEGGEFSPEFKTGQRTISTSPFDGEGMVSPRYSELINHALWTEADAGKHATSFQIRMPFAKGMLHEVDFHRFIADAAEALAEPEAMSDGKRSLTQEGAAAEAPADPDELTIEDAFGIERRWADVQMVITTDMLKCCSWLAGWLETNPQMAARYGNDPMRYYFSEMARFGHGLYLRQTNLPYAQSQVTRLNYQYLNTLCFTQRQFDDFIGKRMRKLVRALTDEKEGQRFLLNSFEYTELDLDDELLELPDEISTWKFALSHDPGFIHDPFIIGELQRAVNSYLVQCAEGHARTEGGMRFLSHDLMEMLNQIARKLLGDGTTLPDTLTGDEIYLPGYEAPPSAAKGAGSRHRLGILRNPHLSRSEECALIPVGGPKKEAYDQYLGHLAGTVLLACDAPNPLALGGADFDGDLVHVIDDADVVKAILAGAYKKSKDGSHTRRYPIPIPDLAPAASADSQNAVDEAAAKGKNTPGQDGSMPGEGRASGEEVGKHITYDQLIRTFDNNIGRISDMAVNFGRFLYGYKASGSAKTSNASRGPKANRPEVDLCADYTIATGMEIDAVKTGLRPKLDSMSIEEMKLRLFPDETAKKQEEPIAEEYQFLTFKRKQASAMKSGVVRVWDVRPPEEGEGSAAMKIRVHNPGRPTIECTTLDYACPGKTSLRGRWSSLIDRLPWLLVDQAETMRESFLTREDDAADGPGLEREAVLEKPQEPRKPTPFSKLITEERPEEQGLGADKIAHLKLIVNAYRTYKKKIKELRQEQDAAADVDDLSKAYCIAASAQSSPSIIDNGIILAEGKLALERYFAGDCPRSLDCVLQEFEDHGFRAWALCPAPQRRQRIAQMMPGLQLPDTLCELIEDDTCQDGCLILFYLLRSVRRDQILQQPLQAQGTFDHILAAKQERGADVGNMRPEQINELVNCDIGLFEKLVGIENRSKRLHYSWDEHNREISQAVREKVLDVLGLDKPLLLIYLLYLREREHCFLKRWDERALFWELLEREDIEPYLPGRKEALWR